MPDPYSSCLNGYIKVSADIRVYGLLHQYLCHGITHFLEGIQLLAQYGNPEITHYLAL